MVRIFLALLLCLLPGAIGFCQSWPPKVHENKTVMIIHRLKGDAYIIRDNKKYTITAFDSKSRAKKKLKPARLAIVNGDRFWLGQDASATISSMGTDGVLGDPQLAGKSYHIESLYTTNDIKLSTEQCLMIRLLLCSAANSKPITDLTRSGLALPLENTLVRSEAIPYCFWQVGKNLASKVSLQYQLNSGEMELGRFEIKRKPYGTLVLDRKGLVERLKQHFGRDEGWDTKAIPITLLLTDSANKTYSSDILLATDKQSNEAAKKLARLVMLLKKPSNDANFQAITKLLTELTDFPAETLYVLAQAKQESQVQLLLEAFAEEFGTEPKALHPKPTR